MFLWNHHILLPFWAILWVWFLLICRVVFCFVVDVREGSGGSGCWCSAADAPTSVFWSCGSDWDKVSSTAGSVFTMLCSSLAIWLSLTRIFCVKFSGCMKYVLKPFLMIYIYIYIYIYILKICLKKSTGFCDAGEGIFWATQLMSCSISGIWYLY